jgi:uncharacterized protein (UPF0335 family)
MSETPGEGHNSITEAAARLRNLVERIERLEEERKALGGDIKDIYAESKSGGFEPKVMRKLIALRKKDPNDVKNEEDLLDLYRVTLGME